MPKLQRQRQRQLQRRCPGPWWLASGALTAAAWAGAVSPASGRLVNDQVTIALIGVGGMGCAHLSSLQEIPGARVVAICDVDESNRQRASETVQKASERAPALFADHREVLDDRTFRFSLPTGRC